MRRFLYWLAPLWTVAASVFLLFGPTYTTTRESVAITQDETRISNGVTSSSRSRFEIQGWVALMPLLIPVALSVVPLVGRSSRGRQILSLAAAVVLATFCVLLIVSIGMFYIPAVIALIIQAQSDKAAPTRSAV
jgi:hypothetical protein